MSKITTHILDAVLGKPAAGIEVRLEVRQDNSWKPCAQGTTDSDGRCTGLAKDAPNATYRLVFDTSAYYARHNRTSIYPEIAITFHCDGVSNYHLPLLLSDNSYTTYRGS